MKKTFFLLSFFFAFSVSAESMCVLVPQKSQNEKIETYMASFVEKQELAKGGACISLSSWESYQGYVASNRVFSSYASLYENACLLSDRRQLESLLHDFMLDIELKGCITNGESDLYHELVFLIDAFQRHWNAESLSSQKMLSALWDQDLYKPFSEQCLDLSFGQIQNELCVLKEEVENYEKNYTTWFSVQDYSKDIEKKQREFEKQSSSRLQNMSDVQYDIESLLQQSYETFLSKSFLRDYFYEQFKKTLFEQKQFFVDVYKSSLVVELEIKKQEMLERTQSLYAVINNNMLVSGKYIHSYQQNTVLGEAFYSSQEVLSHVNAKNNEDRSIWALSESLFTFENEGILSCQL